MDREKENDPNFLYVKNVIEPLEILIKKIQKSEGLSRERLKELDILLLEKYLVLENILQDEINEKT